MNSNHKLGSVRELALFGRLLRRSIVATAVFALAFVVVPCIVAEASAANKAETDVTWKKLTLTLDPDYGNGSMSDEGHGDIDFGEVVPSTANSSGNVGTQKVVKKQIGVFTTGSYYAVYLSMSGSTSGLVKEGDTMGGIEASAGTWASPAAFSDTAWGYAVPNRASLPSGFTTPFAAEGNDGYWGYDDFLVDPTDPDANNLTKNGIGSSVYNTGTWAAVPVASGSGATQPQQIMKNTTANAIGFTDGDFFSVYYSVMVDTDMLAGNYSNSIVYTAMASVNSLDVASTNLIRDVEFVTGQTLETIDIDLATIPSTALVASDLTVAVVPHATMAAANYSTTGLTLTDYPVCAVQSVVSNEHGVTLTCTMPNVGAGSGANQIVIADGTTTLNGEYDFWVRVTKFGQTVDYASKYTRNNNTVAAVVYAGLQSKNASDFYVTEMQEMTASVCANTNRWGTGLGGSAALYNYTGSGSTITTGVPSYSSTVNDTTGGDLGTGSFALKDNRDDKYYLVRRLADGNCWMVQNLDLNLADFAGKTSGKLLTPDNTDISATREDLKTAESVKYYDPQAKLLKDSGQSTVASALSTMYGAAQTVQFQSGQQRNTDVDPQYHWGSTRTSTGANSATTSKSTTVYNSSYAAYARSYDNVTYGYVPTNQTTGAQTNTISNLTTRAGTDGLNSYKTSGWVSLYANQYVGDYYNWYAATAESGTWDMATESVAGSATDSICPKGWQLPYSFSGDDSQSKSWFNLIAVTYGQNTNNGNPSGTSTSISDSEVNIKKFPLSLVRSGYYAWADGNLYARGSGGHFWSSTPYAVTNAHLLEFWGGLLYPRYGSTKANGLTVRCVAR